jgi:large subunit ribosomal protein L16
VLSRSFFSASRSTTMTSISASPLALARRAAPALFPSSPLLLLPPPPPPLLSPAPAPQHHHQQQRRSLVMMPRRPKYRKAHKGLGFNETPVPNTRQLIYGQFGVRALEHARLPARTLEAARRAVRRAAKKTAAIWIRATPSVPVTSKPAEVRMGKGKGAVDYWAAVVRPGQVLFELDRVNKKTAMAALAAVAPKLPMRVGLLEWN